jgi:hypothetical protein
MNDIIFENWIDTEKNMKLLNICGVEIIEQEFVLIDKMNELRINFKIIISILKFHAKKHN